MPPIVIPPADIPTLGHLEPQAGPMGLRRGLSGGGSRDQVAYVLAANAVRLIDASIRDYMLGRDAINRLHAARPHTFGLSETIEAASHFESCLWHLERFIKHAKAIRACPTAEEELKSLVPKGASFLSGTNEGPITQLRHTIAHLESEALKGNVPPGTSLALVPQEQGLTVGHHTLPWNDLTSLLAEAHECAKAISGFKPIPEA